MLKKLTLFSLLGINKGYNSFKQNVFKLYNHCVYEKFHSLLKTCHPLNIINNMSGEGNGTPLHYSCLESPMDGGALKAAIHGVAEGRARLNDFTFTFHSHALEKEMATHSSVLAWRIPGTGVPGGLPSIGSHRVGHDWSDLAATICLR